MGRDRRGRLGVGLDRARVAHPERQVGRGHGVDRVVDGDVDEGEVAGGDGWRRLLRADRGPGLLVPPQDDVLRRTGTGGRLRRDRARCGEEDHEEKQSHDRLPAVVPTLSLTPVR